MLHEDMVRSAAFNLDGTRVLTVSGTTARMWDATTRKPLGAPMRHENEGGIIYAGFNPDGTRVVTATGVTAREWDAVTGRPLGTPIRSGNNAFAATFSPDGTRMVTASLTRRQRREMRQGIARSHGERCGDGQGSGEGDAT